MATAPSNGKHDGRVNGSIDGAHRNGAYLQRSPAPPAPEQPFSLDRAITLRPRHTGKPQRPAAKLAGKVAIITGGDRGIGRAVALAYAREGADVAILHSAHEQGATLTRKGVEDAGRRALTIEGDISDASFCRSAVKQVVDELGRLDILITRRVRAPFTPSRVRWPSSCRRGASA